MDKKRLAPEELNAILNDAWKALGFADDPERNGVHTFVHRASKERYAVFDVAIDEGALDRALAEGALPTYNVIVVVYLDHHNAMWTRPFAEFTAKFERVP